MAAPLRTKQDQFCCCRPNRANPQSCRPSKIERCIMIRFQCESCRRLKKDDEVWILGFAAQNIGLTAARREISIADSWDGMRSVEPLAVHFCSEECQAGYMNALFGKSPDTLQGAST